MVLITKPRGIVRGTIPPDIIKALYAYDSNILKPTDGTHLNNLLAKYLN